MREVGRCSSVDVLPLGDNAFGDVPNESGLDDLGENSVLIHLVLDEAEVVHVPVEGVLLV